VRFIKIMSRIGKQPIILPEGVEAELKEDTLIIKGPKGVLERKLLPEVKVKQKDNVLTVEVDNPKDRKQRALWGLFQRLISNMVKGVVSGYEKKLELVGIGYGAKLQGKKLILKVGFSHPVEFEIPQGIEVKVEKNIITLQGIDKQLVGETAAQIRRIRPPEPYKGKGIKYVDEVIRRKAGKKAATTGAK